MEKSETSSTSSDLLDQSVSQRSSPKSEYFNGAKSTDLFTTPTFVGHVPVIMGPFIKPEVERDPSKMLTTSYHTSDYPSHSSRSRSHTHLKLLPDTSLHRYSSQDEDSGISNSFNTSSRWRSSSNLSTSMSLPSKPNYTTLDSSFTIPTRSHELSTRSYESPNRSHELASSSLRKNGYTKSVASYEGDKYSPSKHTSFSPSTYGSLELAKSKSMNLMDIQSQLDQSEKRRSLLVEKLTEARSTIKLQSDRLDEAESGYRDSSFTLEDYRNRERKNFPKSVDVLFPYGRSHSKSHNKEYKKKIDVMENEKQEYQSRRIESLKQREELQDRIGGLENEIGLIKTSYTLMEHESKRRDDIIQQKSQAMTLIEEENLNLIKSKDSLSKESKAMKESLEISRNRNEWLENQMQDIKTELTALRQENKSLSVENRSLHNQTSELKESNMMTKEENRTHMSAMKQLHHEKLTLQRQLDTFHDNVADLKANLATTTSDKERYFQEKLDLHQKLQNAILDRETAIKEKYAIDERLNELSAEMAQASLRTDKKKEDWRRLEDELTAVKKVGEVLSLELASTKANLEKALERNQSLEQTKKIAFQQHTLYEQEIKSLENQLSNMRKSLESIQDGHKKERDGLDGSTMKLREELRQVKSERNQIELRVHELEAGKKQSEQNLKQENKLQKQELGTWKNSCETMTASLSRKEMEVQQLSKKLHDLEEQTSFMKLNEQSLQTQYSELVEAKEQVERLGRENRHLQQERTENQQVIQLLEMQKSILAKTSETGINKSHDMPSHDTTQLKCQVEMLTSENQAIQVKVQQLEQIRDELIREKEERLSNGDLYFPSRKLPASQTGDSAISSNSNKQLQEMEKQNKQLRDVNTMVTEQLARVEKHNAQLRANDSETSFKHDLRRLEMEKENLEEENKHLKSQYKHLEEMYQKHREDNNTHNDLVSLQRDNQSREEQIRNLQRDKHTLDNQVISMEGEVRSLKNDKNKLQEETQTLQHKLADVNKQLNEYSLDQVHETKEMHGLKKELSQLQSQLDDSRNVQNKQDDLILSLKAELDDEKTKKPHRIKQSLDDVGSELNVMRKELQKLMGVIKMKDQEIENLGSELKTTKRQVTDSREQEKDVLEEKVFSLEKDNNDLQQELDRLKTELSDAESQLEKLEQQLKDTQLAREEDSKKAADKLRRELTAKDRQIESLEEQLRRNTSAEIRRLKREASKVELLKQDNRRLSNEIAQVKGSTMKGGSTTEDHDSWDSDSVHDPVMKKPLNKSLAEELEEAEENQAMKEIAEDEDVRNVVAMLENVEFNDTLPLSTYNDDDGADNRAGNVQCNIDYESSGEETPRNESPVNGLTYELDNSISKSRVNGDTTRSRTNGSRQEDSYSRSGSDQSDSNRRPSRRTAAGSRFRITDDEGAVSDDEHSSSDGAFPSPKMSETPKRSASSNYKLTTADNSSHRRSRSRSPSNSPSRYERSRSYERSHDNDVGNTYVARSRSYDRRTPGRSVSHDVTTTTGYGSLTSSIGLRSSLGTTDLNVRSLPDSSGQRYRSSLNDLGPSPGETKEERRKRMRELLRTLDKTTSRY